MIAFDTDVLTEVLLGNTVYGGRAAAIPLYEQAVPVIVVEEILRGRLHIRGRIVPRGTRPSTGPEKRSAPRAGQRRGGAVARRWRPLARSLRDRSRLEPGASERQVLGRRGPGQLCLCALTPHAPLLVFGGGRLPASELPW